MTDSFFDGYVSAGQLRETLRDIDIKDYELVTGEVEGKPAWGISVKYAEGWEETDGWATPNCWFPTEDCRSFYLAGLYQGSIISRPTP